MSWWRPARSAALLDAVFVVSALVAIASAQWAPDSAIHMVAKPLATLCMVLRIGLDHSYGQLQIQRRLLLAMMAALVGDILLLNTHWFVWGLLSFLVCHLLLLSAYSFRSRLFWPPWPLLVLLTFGAANLWLLWPSLPDGLKLPVSAYVVVLLLMAAQAIARSLARTQGFERDAWRQTARIGALGAVLFVVSDTVLAWNRFHGALWLGPLWVLSTYYGAIFCIARTARHEEP